jgi:hypothetical protein
MVGVSVLDVPMWKELHFHDKIQFLHHANGIPEAGRVAASAGKRVCSLKIVRWWAGFNVGHAKGRGYFYCVVRSIFNIACYVTMGGYMNT